MVEGKRAADRFVGLDVLRGVAALSVIFWHWQHFFVDSTDLANGVVSVDSGDLPLYRFFVPLYDNGWRAVDLFFCLSGFIFYGLYANKVRDRQTTGGRFAWWRLSRLYPLHLVTLLLVAGLQATLLTQHGRYFVYENNDANHLALQVLFVSAWGFEDGHSFNGPIWSVSIEVLMYLAFFALCRVGLVRPWQTALLAVSGLALQAAGFVLIGRGVLSFFAGGVAFYLFSAVRQRRSVTGGLLAAAVALAAALWVAVPLLASQDLPGPLGRAVPYTYELVLYPATIAVLALIEPHLKGALTRWAWLGDISYSVYLLHFPLQIALVLAVESLAFSADVYRSPVTLVAFFAVAIVLSRWSFEHFERPMMQWMRARYASRRLVLRPS